MEINKAGEKCFVMAAEMRKKEVREEDEEIV